MKKQAVILIHGIGEQVPMDTLRSFVKAVWTTDDSLRTEYAPSTTWSKPDQMSGDFELRRLTTARSHENKLTDFFEFYWAHMMEGTQVAHLLAWAKLLLLRRPDSVPKQLRGLWCFLVGTALVVVLAIIASFIWADSIPVWLKHAVRFGGSAVWVLIGSFVVKKVAGDAARYLHVAPPNIESRHRIRTAGVKLLRRLHASGEYDRIIVVGHSLGTVIGYDILTYSWAHYNNRLKADASLATTALAALEELARNPKEDPGYVEVWQTAQSAYLKELQAAEHPWLVTDFVTMGSPLAHATLLLGRTADEFESRKTEREFPTCPPVLEEDTTDGKTERKFTYKSDKLWIPHHAAVFGPTRWTNLYFPCHYTICGDVIGGPVRPAFGMGIRDVPVTTCLQGGIFTHTLYWTLPKTYCDKCAPPWITSLRQAVRLCKKPKPVPAPKPLHPTPAAPQVA